ncbi:MAG TPA: hypothetical protein VF050_10975 [Moraxellaceae bacterium]
MRALSPALILCTALLATTTYGAEAATPATAATPAKATAAAPAEAADAADTAEAATEEVAGPGIYMVARVKLTGTDFTQVVFFKHNAITTLEACEAERNAGLTTGWNHYSRYYLKTFKGIAYKVDYRCVESDQRIAFWRYGVPYNHFYLVRTTDSKLKVEAYSNFFACRRALNPGKTEETIDAFCTMSSQEILDKKKG